MHKRGELNVSLEQLGAIRPGLLRRARALIGNFADAEDLVQSAMERAIVRCDAFRPDTELNPWLSTVIRNLVIDQVRSVWRSRVISRDMNEMPCQDPESSPWWQELTEAQVRNALQRCAPVLREAFVLHHYAGLSLSQIAAQHGISTNTVGTRLFRARAFLRQTLTARARRDGRIPDAAAG
jgi:RNA polymerase sigma-70 factor (ECF subfamily)